MADHNGGKAKPFLILGNHAQDGVFPDGVLSRGGLVEKYDLGIGHQGPCQGHPSAARPGDVEPTDRFPDQPQTVISRPRDARAVP